jgi:hypothetical protein
LQVAGDWATGTHVQTVFRFSPQATVFAIDPFAGRLAVYDPSLSVQVTQDLPTFGLPVRAQAVIDARNLFDFQTRTMNGESLLEVGLVRPHRSRRNSGSVLKQERRHLLQASVSPSLTGFSKISDEYEKMESSLTRLDRSQSETTAKSQSWANRCNNLAMSSWNIGCLNLTELVCNRFARMRGRMNS